MTERQGKGGKSRRVPLNSQTRQALSAYLAERGEGEGERLFLGQRGPMSEWGIHELVKKYAYQARLEDVTAHTLRHTFAKNLVDAGVPLDQVATLWGTKVWIRPGCIPNRVSATWSWR